MVKQLGTPTIFLTFSCVDLQWNELISIAFKLNGIDITDEDIYTDCLIMKDVTF